MAIVGRACLILAFATALYGIAASLYGARARRPDWAESGRRAVYAMAVLASVAFLVLEIAFLRSDFSFSTVATHSSTTTPGFYKASAVWSSQEGSLLLWAMLLAFWSSVILYASRNKLREIAPYATAVLCGFAVFFVGLLVFMESPFAALSPVPPEGVGLNPLLRHPSMMIHPPMLYSGYTRDGTTTHFRVRDRTGGHASVPVTYQGTLPDPFREGREVIVTVRKQGDVFVGQKDSLVTKCPSKFTAAKS